MDEAGETRLPTDDELRLIREVVDPKSLRDRDTLMIVPPLPASGRYPTHRFVPASGWYPTASSAVGMKLRTPLTEMVGVEHPVVQTGMGWVAGARLVAATANAGGLGILASATMTLDELATAIGKVKAATDKPFGVNIRADAADAGDRVDLMIREGVKVASFALAPKQELIARLKEAGAVVIPSIGAAKHARKVAAWGADAMIVQGGEGGGHTGPVATTLLLPSVLDAVQGTGIPVIAAGDSSTGAGWRPR